MVIQIVFQLKNVYGSTEWCLAPHSDANLQSEIHYQYFDMLRNGYSPQEIGFIKIFRFNFS